ncbi:N,N-dimethylformamidase beta subunit family domain-containing protein [Streptomyces sp. H39-C1]|uniref:N,N-dimethylformamidase beta subunit family domain-containing protein n=1 Tax=Streptomyces sp. H39-C1 TaxID=3004355 RepID=UPI0022AE8CF1|nr:N,N-dimethylformamidase beta subunit family domain-containing protein [Streptomyces sp. H39-C1]MCZ4100676.1 hypothetical protein [Streptomyces sp. H39-C1]
MNVRRIILLMCALGALIAIAVPAVPYVLDHTRDAVAASVPESATGTAPHKVAEVAPPPRQSTGDFSVSKENALPGTRAWEVRNPGPQNAIEGYTNHVSVTSGQPFDLYVSTTASSFEVQAFRMGYYGGKQGRLVWSSKSVRGQIQPPAKVVPGIFMATAPWKPSMSIGTKGWPEGDYLLKLTSRKGNERNVPITVRSTSTAGKTVFVNATATWQAYNSWGGHNIYAGPPGPRSYAERSRKVSFDRPYDRGGSGQFLWHELPMLVTAEKLGLRMAYVTSSELDNMPELFKGARSLIFSSHDEYWSSGMRDTATKARDTGINMAFFGANNVYRHVRFEASALGDQRVVTCYKDPSEDPMVLTDPNEATQQWRLPPNPRPESELLGVQYEWLGVTAPYVVTDADSWVYAGTGAKNGSKYPGLVAVEYDKLFTGPEVPRPIQALSDSPVTLGKKHSFSNSTYYTTPSGAGVFSSGTLGWTCTVNNDRCSYRVPQSSVKFARKVSENILTAFQAGPAGAKHPAVDNYNTYARPPAGFSYAH